MKTQSEGRLLRRLLDVVWTDGRAGGDTGLTTSTMTGAHTSVLSTGKILKAACLEPRSP